MSLDQLLTDVLASPPDTEWTVDDDESWGIYHRTYRGHHLQVVDESPDGCSWMLWLNRDEDYGPHADGDAPSVAIAKLRAERAAEGEDGGPATDALKLINDYTEDVTP